MIATTFFFVYFSAHENDARTSGGQDKLDRAGHSNEASAFSNERISWHSPHSAIDLSGNSVPDPGVSRTR